MTLRDEVTGLLQSLLRLNTVNPPGNETLAAAFLRAGLVDEVHAYVAPVLLGAGRAAVADLGVTTIEDALRLEPVHVQPLGTDVLVVATPRKEES